VELEENAWEAKTEDSYRIVYRWSRDKLVGIAARYRLEVSSLESGEGNKFYPLHILFRPIQKPTQPLFKNRYWALSRGKAARSWPPLSSGEIKMSGDVPLLVLCTCMISYGEAFTFNKLGIHSIMLLEDGRANVLFVITTWTAVRAWRPRSSTNWWNLP
jgi:hypothetical protein